MESAGARHSSRLALPLALAAALGATVGSARTPAQPSPAESVPPSSVSAPIYLPFAALGATRPVAPVALREVADVWHGDAGGVAWSGGRIVAAIGPRLALLGPGRDGFDMVIGTSAPLTSPIRAVAATADRAVAVTDAGDVVTVDLTTPAAPRVAGSLRLDYDRDRLRHFEIGLHDDHAYVGVGGAGVAVVDLADPAAPRLVRWVDGLQNVFGLVVTAGRLYTLEDRTGMEYRVPLTVYDLAQPDAPARRGAVDVQAGPSLPAHGGLAARGDTVVVVLDSRLTVLDVADPDRPQPHGRLDLEPVLGPRVVALAGDAAVVGSLVTDGVLASVDIATPAAPRLRATVPVPYGIYGLAADPDGERLAASTVAYSDTDLGTYRGHGGGVAVSLWPQSGEPGLAGSLAPPYYVRDFDCAGAWCFISDHSAVAGIQALDLSRPAQPTLRGRLPLPERLTTLRAMPGLVVGITARRLYLADVSDPARPRLTAGLDLGEQQSALTVAGGFAFVTDIRTSLAGGGDPTPIPPLDLRVVDLSDAMRPRLRSTYPLDVGLMAAPAAAGTSVFILGRGRRGEHWKDVVDLPTFLIVLDARDPTNLREIARVPVPGDGWPGLLAVDGDRLWAMTADPRLLRFDITDPERPRFEGGSPVVPLAAGVLPFGPRVLIADCFERLAMYDFARPGDAVLVGAMPALPDWPRDENCGDEGGAVALANGHVVVGLGTGGLRVVALDPTPDELRNHRRFAGPASEGATRSSVPAGD